MLSTCPTVFNRRIRGTKNVSKHRITDKAKKTISKNKVIPIATINSPIIQWYSLVKYMFRPSNWAGTYM